MAINASSIIIKHDGQVWIATGQNRKSTQWRNLELHWSELLNKLCFTTRTRETYTEYKKMSKDAQADVKDVGGFVGGMLKSGRRKTGSVAWRSLLTLDADFAPVALWNTVEMLFGNAIALYSTHSHNPETPRLRLVAPFSRPVQPDEYKAISRFLAAEIGIDFFDDSTFEAERLMYWPSTSIDGEYVFKYLDGPWIDPDRILQTHPYWSDTSTWPESSRTKRTREKHAEKQGDPRTKPGAIGAFCRTYSITSAIEKYLPDVYVACDMANRYTFKNGTTAAGLVVYDDDLFAYSYHGTDPAGGQLCNAFDLVRIHKFNQLDEDSKFDTPVNRLPSYKAMLDWAVQDEAVRIELASSKLNDAQVDFNAPQGEKEGETDNTWKAKLSYNERGGLQPTIHNAVMILRNDPALKTCPGYDEFTRRAMLRNSPPWRVTKEPTQWIDTDDAGLRHYLERVYGLKGRENIQDALELVIHENKYHPIREYLDSIKWDGIRRLDTLLIDYLGAEDMPYTREVTRKWMVAGTARIRNPGCKFDNMLILVGSQGLGKSQFISRLAVHPSWFTDSMSQFDNSKESMEQLVGKWLVEVGELSVMKRAEVEHVKVFLTKQDDSYRPSYGRRQETFQRQCIFAGTTNRDDFLQDATGNRRFWPVEVTDASRMWKHLSPDVIDQLWAEADMYRASGEELYLANDINQTAMDQQNRYTELGGKMGVAEDFLARKLPANWDDRTIKEKLEWLNGYSFDTAEGVAPRTKISGVELYVECFNGRIENYRKLDAYEMSDILRRLGWKKAQGFIHRNDYGKQRYFYNNDSFDKIRQS